MNYNKFIGGLYGVAIGDALGAPFEFARALPKVPYTGLFTDEKVTVQFQYHKMAIEPHSITDDTEMTLQLLSSILKNGGYDKEKTVQEYLDWANLPSTPMGKNTRALMKGVTLAKNFAKRRDKVMGDQDARNQMQSNGSLMRCFPLVMLDNWEEVSDIDCSLTNDNEINRLCSYIYLRVAKSLIYGNPFFSLPSDVFRDPFVKPVKDAVFNATSGKLVDVSENKGWVVHALYVALITLFNSNSFDDGMSYIHRNFFGTPSKPSDTDTLMAIAGGLLGAKYGLQHMKSETKCLQNIQFIDEYFDGNVNQNRPKFTAQMLVDVCNFRQKI